MFAFLRFVIWTAACIAMGVFFATYEVGGKTPLQYAEQYWKRSAPTLPSMDEVVKSGAGGVMDEAKKRLGVKDEKPVEHHSSEDRDAVNRLIAKRAQR